MLRRATSGDATIDVTMPLLGNFTPRYRRLLEKFLPSADILIGAHPWMFPFFPGEKHRPRVYDSQNCESRLKGPLLRRSLAGRYLARRVTGAERLAVESSELILACSPEDAEAFFELYGAGPDRVLVVPNGVDCAEIAPADARTKREARERLGIGPNVFALFTGSNYVPNLEGAAFIIEQLAPAHTETIFGIAGGVGPMYRDTYRDRSIPGNVRIYGFVERATLLDLYASADLALNPMFQGSGTNIKMLDYMAAGLPIVTTPKGARGIAGRSGEHWIETSPESFVRDFERVASAHELRIALGRPARDLAEAQYDWKSISARLAEALRPLVRKNAPALSSLK
jgi:glycosyltransferase involved in cell wall biosynthesis